MFPLTELLGSVHDQEFPVWPRPLCHHRAPDVASLQDLRGLKSDETGLLFPFFFCYNSRAVLGYQSTSSAGIRILTNRFQARLHAPAVPGQDAPLDSCSPTQAFSHVRESMASASMS